MTHSQILMEISYVLGIRYQELENAIEETEREMLIDDFTNFVENLAKSFNIWQENKDDSTLQLLHDFLDEVFADLRESVKLYW